MLPAFGLLALVRLHTSAQPERGVDQIPFAGTPSLVLPGVTEASGLTAMDLDANRRLDLAVLSGESHQLLVLLNRGGRRFVTAPRASIDSSTSMALGDFNEDGKLDIAASSHSRSEVRIMLGKGDGSFRPGQTFRVPVHSPHCHMIAAADVNNDNHLDLLLAQSDDNQAWVFLGDGKGSFVKSPSAPTQTGRHPYVVATGDFNRDGNLDFATPNWHDRTLSVFMGNGKGEFRQAQGSPVGGLTAPTALAAGDIDDDGNCDLVVGNNGVRGLQVLLGDGKGGFKLGSVADLDSPEPCFGPTVADLNGDGRLDVIATGTNGARTFSYWLNLGGGRFSAAHTLPCPGGANSICVADLDGDGAVDLAVGTWANAQTFVWFKV